MQVTLNGILMRVDIQTSKAGNEYGMLRIWNGKDKIASVFCTAETANSMREMEGKEVALPVTVDVRGAGSLDWRAVEEDRT